ncbi:MAG: prolyl oligopeptidase family serine peptidase [Gemmatimonadota bacterium]
MRHPFPRSAASLGACAALLLALAPQLAAQEANGLPAEFTSEQWLTPPPEIADAVLAPRHLNVTLSNRSPEGSLFLNSVGQGLADMADYARPHVYLGGLQVDTAANRSRRFTARHDQAIELIRWETGQKTVVERPQGSLGISSASWSPDGSRIAYMAHFPNATYLYVANTSNGRAERVTDRALMPVEYTGFDWTADGSAIGALVVPQNRGAKPVAPAAPTTPKLKVTEEGENRLRVYASLLETPHDKDLLRYYTTAQLASINVANGRVRTIGQPAMITGVSVAPNGQHFRVTTMQEPFSYIVPVSSFGSTEELWDADGNVLQEISTREIRTGISGGDDDDEEDEEAPKRSLSWHIDGSSLTYLQRDPAPDSTAAGEEQEEQEEQESQRPRRMDRLFVWAPPFDDASATEIYRTTGQIQSARFSEDSNLLFVTEGSGGSSHEYAVYLDDPELTKHTINRRQGGGRQSITEDQGSLLSTRNDMGVSVVRLSPDRTGAYLQGTKYYEDPQENAPHPFIDRITIRGGEKERIYEGDNNGVSERVLEIMDDALTTLMVQRESPTEIGQSYLKNLQTGELRQLTNNVDYHPDITNARRLTYDVERVDGITFRTQVTVPADWRQGQKLPAIFWFYPREYDDQEDYDRTHERFNKNSFPNVGARSMDFLIKHGYAVVEPDAPIIDEDLPNNNYVHDLRNNLYAVIDKLDGEGVIDRTRLAAGGHSYGAFSTANAMVNTPFFKAGIAGDGNYNRTLTAIGFQSERRDLWEAREVYLSMSPFLFANNMSGALLMYHGEMDQNVGTAPIHSEKMFHALNGLGKPAAMYMYPYEDHGPATRETTLDLWARWTAWLDYWVKNADQRTADPQIISDGSGG